MNQLAEELTAALRHIQESDADLFHEKQLDYGPENISAGWQALGLMSLWQRMNDKVARLGNLAASQEEPKNESIMDTLADLANYAGIARLCLMGSWPGVGEGEEE